MTSKPKILVVDDAGPDRVSEGLEDIDAEDHDRPCIVDHEDLRLGCHHSASASNRAAAPGASAGRRSNWRLICLSRACGIVTNASAITGSKWVRTPREISSIAAAMGRLARYGRSEVNASKASATVTTRAMSGMASP